MRNLRANESKLVGILGLIGIVLTGIAIIATASDLSLPTGILLLIAMFFSGFTAWFGFRAASIFVDEDDLLYQPANSDYIRVSISSVISAKTFPLPFKLGMLVLQFDTGFSIMTVVQQHDLSWIMSRMPEYAITPYWKNRIG